jgi:hypothetical protein
MKCIENLERLARNKKIVGAGKFCPLAHIKWKLWCYLPLHTQNWETLENTLQYTGCHKNKIHLHHLILLKTHKSNSCFTYLFCNYPRQLWETTQNCFWESAMRNIMFQEQNFIFSVFVTNFTKSPYKMPLQIKHKITQVPHGIFPKLFTYILIVSKIFFKGFQTRKSIWGFMFNLIISFFSLIFSKWNRFVLFFLSINYAIT